MAKVNILHPFNLQLENGASVAFFAGGSYVPDEFMGHPLVLANIEQPGETPAAPVPKPVAAPVEPDDIEESADEIAEDAKLASEGVTREALLDQAKALGIVVDGRWGMARLQAEIDKADK